MIGTLAVCIHCGAHDFSLCELTQVENECRVRVSNPPAGWSFGRYQISEGGAYMLGGVCPNCVDRLDELGVPNIKTPPPILRGGGA